MCGRRCLLSVISPHWRVVFAKNSGEQMANSTSGRGGRTPEDKEQFADFWTGCSPETQDAFASSVSGIREIKAGNDLFRSHDSSTAVFGVLRGWMFLYQMLDDGRRQILHFAFPGAVLGYTTTSGALMTYSVQALSDAAVWVAPRGDFEQLCRRHSELGLRLAEKMARDYVLAFDHLSNIGRRSARERIARLLLELFIRSRMRWPSQRPEELYLPLTQEHIGDATGLSSVHVNRVVRGLRKRGVLEFHYRRLRILDPDQLVEIAGIDPRSALSWIARD